jgi:hypothetical protein
MEKPGIPVTKKADWGTEWSWTRWKGEKFLSKIGMEKPTS